MADVQEVRDGEKRHITRSMSDFPRDLLQSFINVNKFPLKLEEPREDAEDIELTLGLSLNGRFGIDPRGKKIKRTSSIPEFMNPVRDKDMGYVMPKTCAPLMRTCSLPTETEEEWRRRKELQTLRRMEARRKRSEKQRNSKLVRERSRALSEEIREEDKPSELVDGNNQSEQGAGTSNTSLGSTSFSGASGLPPPSSLSQGSSGSLRSGSSGISQSESQSAQGIKSVEARSPISANSSPKSQATSRTIAGNSGKTDAIPTGNHSNKIVRNVLEDMPCVTTKGEGPDGKRIQGFLYRYRKGEEVRIVCVCHGTFLTPAEFVKHAGGGDVAHPLKHIVVSPSFF
ncbi:hypothetical protein L6164_006712 [Bauhinia variegata]|uniref:Uncharacterized protein n=1 Tax=Bauhinia variegata TaxID=167791 RepID=A0ACB9PV42_BAUVA|nr:hypothetical protein L6164_006712 [Bauhinia variegata]